MTSNWAGGIAGSSNISNCYNLGNIEGNSIGGIVGTTQTNTVNCYNKGIIKGNASSSGGIIGNCHLDDNSSLEGNYYLEGTAQGGARGKDLPGQAEPLPESEMPSVMEVISTGVEQVEWNGEMVDVWKEDTENINNGYPILFWQ